MSCYAGETSGVSAFGETVEDWEAFFDAEPVAQVLRYVDFRAEQIGLDQHEWSLIGTTTTAAEMTGIDWDAIPEENPQSTVQQWFKEAYDRIRTVLNANEVRDCKRWRWTDRVALLADLGDVDGVTFSGGSYTITWMREKWKAVRDGLLAVLDAMDQQTSDAWEDATQDIGFPVVSGIGSGSSFAWHPLTEGIDVDFFDGDPDDVTCFENFDETISLDVWKAEKFVVPSYSAGPQVPLCAGSGSFSSLSAGIAVAQIKQPPFGLGYVYKQSSYGGVATLSADSMCDFGAISITPSATYSVSGEISEPLEDDIDVHISLTITPIGNMSYDVTPGASFSVPIAAGQTAFSGSATITLEADQHTGKPYYLFSLSEDHTCLGATPVSTHTASINSEVIGSVGVTAFSVDFGDQKICRDACGNLRVITP